MQRPLLLFALLLASPSAHAEEEAHWIWPHAYANHSAQAGEIFLLQRHFPKKGPPVGRGPSPHLWKGAKIHFVFRLEREPQPREVLDAFRILQKSWERSGTEVAGLQLDYDSPTAKLGQYAKTLAEIRAGLPKEQALSITGLPDWLRVDPWKDRSVSVFYQLYRGKRAEPELDAYLEGALHCSVPFRVGLLESQSLSPAQKTLLAQNKNFQGTVRFLGAP